MAFALFVLRPGLAVLPPAQRLTVLARVFARFLPVVGVAVLVIVATGGWLLLQYEGLRNAPWGVHAMIALGLVMIAVYAWVAVRLNPRLQAAVRAEDWPGGGGAAESIRRWVLINLALGVLVIVAGIAGGG
jgi:uncharacterized membrane protein